MSRWKPCKRTEFIQKLRKLGFSGPLSGTKHQFMIYQKKRLAIPSNNEYSVAQVKFMIREIERIIERPVTLDEWEKL